MIEKTFIGNISAAIHYPQTITGKLAILVPGYLDSKDYPHLVGLADDLNKEGFTVVRFDPTGTWGSKGVISDYTIPRQFDDIKAVLDFTLQKNPYTEILLGGHSRGGFVSILYAARDARISCVLGIMSPYTLVRTVNKDKIQKWKDEGFRISTRDTIEGGKKEFCVPYSNMEADKNFNAVSEVKKLHIPLILIAGENDDLIPPADVQSIFDNANEPKKMVVIKKVDHDYRLSGESIKRVNTEILNSLAEMKITK